MKRLLGNVEFCNEKCNVYIYRGSAGFDDRFRITLESAADGMPVATASVWTANLKKGEFAIKDYSENEGLLDRLIESQIVQPPHRYVESGFVNLPIVRLTPKSNFII
jgi:hypothetical protein